MEARQPHVSRAYPAKPTFRPTPAERRARGRGRLPTFAAAIGERGHDAQAYWLILPTWPMGCRGSRVDKDMRPPEYTSDYVWSQDAPRQGHFGRIKHAGLTDKVAPTTGRRSIAAGDLVRMSIYIL